MLANNYMETRLLEIRGVTKSHPELTRPRMEMTRYSLGQLTEETGVTAVDVQNRMVDFGIDAFWLSHEPWLVPEPFTPEAGEMWSKEDIDYWIDVLQHICEEAYTDPEIVRSAPHNQVVHRLTRPASMIPTAGRRRGGRTSASTRSLPLRRSGPLGKLSSNTPTLIFAVYCEVAARQDVRRVIADRMGAGHSRRLRTRAATS